MGSTGAVRSKAWIWGFSSTANTTAPSGGARYSPTTSRILLVSSPSSLTNHLQQNMTQVVMAELKTGSLARHRR